MLQKTTVIEIETIRFVNLPSNQERFPLSIVPQILTWLLEVPRVNIKIIIIWSEKTAEIENKTRKLKQETLD